MVGWAGWIVAGTCGVLLALAQYGRREFHRGAAHVTAAVCRAASVTLLAALLLNLPRARGRVPAPRIALDASVSMLRAGGVWTAAMDTLRARGAMGDSVLLFGDSERTVAAASLRGGGQAVATAGASTIRPVIDQALAEGRGVVAITDGELDDAADARELPAGSRMIVLQRAARPDLAVTSIEAPRATVSGDSAQITVTVAAGASGSHAGAVAILLDQQTIARIALDSLPPLSVRTLRASTMLAGAPGPRVLRAIATSAGDAEPANDTAAVVLELSTAATAVFVATSPDFDTRYALAVLRGSLRIPTRGFFRVAQGQWRVDGSLAPVSESDVRQAVHDAPVVILQGDTAVFGPPRSVTIGPLALLVPPQTDQGEWYPAAAPASPLSAALSDVRWDSLAPIAVGELPGPPAQSWQGLTTRLARGASTRPVVVGVDEPRRVAVIPASGMWRWAFRGGVANDAFTAFWGGIFDWLAAERADRRAAVPDDPLLRAGDPVRWRRGSSRDSVVNVVLRPRSAKARPDSLQLHFAPGSNVIETPPLLPGLYDVGVNGGSALLAVNVSREWLPRRPTVKSGSVGGAAPLGADEQLRGVGWPYVLVVLLLCVEWLVRRQSGLR